MQQQQHEAPLHRDCTQKGQTRHVLKPWFFPGLRSLTQGCSQRSRNGMNSTKSPPGNCSIPVHHFWENNGVCLSHTGLQRNKHPSLGDVFPILFMFFPSAVNEHLVCGFGRLLSTNLYAKNAPKISYSKLPLESGAQQPHFHPSPILGTRIFLRICARFPKKGSQTGQTGIIKTEKNHYQQNEII